MKTGQIIATIFVAGLVTGSNSMAQTARTKQTGQAPYTTAIGIRGGFTSGFTFKHFFSASNAMEGIAGFWPNSFSLTGLYEKHVEAGNAEGFNWYYGGGGHVSFNSGRIYHYAEGRRYFFPYEPGETGLGVDGILGLEYKIPPIPFALSLDIKPFLEITNMGNTYISLDPGMGIKVTF